MTSTIRSEAGLNHIFAVWANTFRTINTISKVTIIGGVIILAEAGGTL